MPEYSIDGEGAPFSSDLLFALNNNEPIELTYGDLSGEKTMTANFNIFDAGLSTSNEGKYHMVFFGEEEGTSRPVKIKTLSDYSREVGIDTIEFESEVLCS